MDILRFLVQVWQLESFSSLAMDWEVWVRALSFQEREGKDKARSNSRGKMGWSYWESCFLHLFSSVQFSCSVVSDSLRPHESQHARPPCPSPSPGVRSYSHPSSWWCHPAISSSVVPFSSCPQSLPASGSFQKSQFFTSGGQSIEVSTSASVLPVNTQDWSPLGWTGWISFQSKGLSRVFSNTTWFKSINSLPLSLLHGPTLTSIHDYWKNYSFDYTDLCRKSNVSAF